MDLGLYLSNMKMLWDLIEDRLEFSEQTKKNIADSQKEIKQGKTASLEEIKKKLEM